MKVGLYSPLLSEHPASLQIYFINLAKELKSHKNIEPYLLCERVGTHSLYGEMQKFSLSKVPIIDALKIGKENFDIIHFNGIPIRIKKLFIAKILQNEKKIATVHGDVVYSEPSLYDYGNSIEAVYSRFMQPLASKWLDLLIPVSNDLGKRLRRFLHISGNKIRPIYCGIDHNLFRPIKNSRSMISEKFGIKKDFILHVSNLSMRKNPSGLIRTYEKLVEQRSDLDLVIIGRRWKQWVDKYKTQNGKIRKGNIKVIGVVSSEDLPTFYSAADIFFFPSFHENFGFPIVEAMACGTPVVTSNAYSIPEISGGAAILCNPKDLASFVNGIKLVRNDNSTRMEMIKKGLINAKKFTWTQCGKEMVNVYKEVVDCK